MPRKVFISYRRDDTKWQAREIYRALTQVLPRDHVFMDIDSIPIGIDFVEFLEGWVNQCDIMLALIGAGWADGIDPKTGRPRLENPNDFVRIEVRKGLARGIPVVPILLDGAQLPDVAQLPDDLPRLVRRNAEFIEHRTVDSDVERLIRRLRLTEQSAQPVSENAAAVEVRNRTEGRIAAGIEVASRLNRLKSSVRQVHWGWIGAIAALMLTIGYVGTNNIPAWWRGSSRRADREAAQRDPALSVKPGSGQSFRDRLADGQPCPMCPEMVVAPAGIFTMGSQEKEEGHSDGVGDEAQVPVTIARPFAVGKFVVTFAEWDACVAGGCKGYRPDDRGWGRVRRPAINVSWSDAKLYIDWLNAKTGKTYRLLSEAEREYVTRAGTTTPFWWGSSITPKQANYASVETYGTVPVDSFEANPWGLFNVHGNVWEWTEDCWKNSNQGNPGDGSARTTGDSWRALSAAVPGAAFRWPSALPPA